MVNRPNVGAAFGPSTAVSFAIVCVCTACALFDVFIVASRSRSADRLQVRVVHTGHVVIESTVSESEGTQQVLKVRRHVPQSIASRPAQTSRAVATSRTRASRCRRRRCVSLARRGPSSRRSARAPGPRRGISPASPHRRRRPPPAHTARRSLKCAATAPGRRRPPPRRRAASRVPSAPVP